MKYEDNPRSIKFHVKRWLQANEARFRGKQIIDFPAGNGVTTRILADIGAVPVAYDLFPEYWELTDIPCLRANIRHGLPAATGKADALICQEGIEHFSDQFGALREFNRVLKPGGILLITTPNYSNLRARLSYMLGESERFNTMLAPNELDSIWMARHDITDEVYFGHIFLIGIQKLRVLARLSGFEIKEVVKTRIKPTSVLLFPLIYPFILLTNYIALRKSLRKNKDFNHATKKAVYGEVFRLSVSPRVLLTSHLMVEFVKVREAAEVIDSLKSKHAGFGVT